MSNDTKKGLSPLAWVAIGCGALVLVVFIGIVAVGGFAVFKAKEFVDENVDIGEDGSVSIKTAEGAIEVDTSEGGASLTVEGKDGSQTTWGADASMENVPEWAKEMIYPNATRAFSTLNSQTTEGVVGAITMTTTDAPREIVDFFQKQLLDGGYKITAKSTQSLPHGQISTIAGEHEDTGRTINVGVVKNEGQSQVTFNYNGKS